MRQKAVRFTIFWMPVILYCVAIFAVSSLPQPLPRDIKIPFLDKFLHLIEYGVLGFLLIRALSASKAGFSRKRIFVLAVILAALYGATDEIHQMCVPGRYPSLVDLLFDFIGAASAGLFINR